MSIVEEVRWFLRESPSFMAGTSRLEYYRRLPRALLKFVWLATMWRVSQIWRKDAA